MAERRKRKLIGQKCPTTKVIFLTQQTDSDVKQGAMEAGTIASSVKSHVFTDLSSHHGGSASCFRSTSFLSPKP